MGVDGFDWTTMPTRAASGERLHLALIEIANFGALRQVIGVQRADLLLLDVAERVAALVPAATVSTAGRNLIELYLRDEREDALAAVVATLTAGFAGPITVDGAPHRVRLTFGCACSAAGHLDEVRLIEEAERALTAKRAGGTGIDPAVGAIIAPDEAQIGRELRDAITRGELFLQYQPKLHLRQQKIASIEALIRWQHPRRGLVLPNDFIPAAERTGDIAAMTLWTLDQVVADQRTMLRNGHDLPVYINMAGALLSDARFVDQVIGLLGASRARIGIEITETSMIRDPQGAIGHLQRLADIGVAIAIDDYGAGLSSLAYLKQLPASELKIDKLFVTQLTSSHRDPLIVRSTIDLAHALEMEVVAEGVETPASLALLSVMGCDLVQGFLISRPLGVEALLSFLDDDRHLTLATAQRSPLERLAAVRARG